MLRADRWPRPAHGRAGCVVQIGRLLIGRGQIVQALQLPQFKENSGAPRHRIGEPHGIGNSATALLGRNRGGNDDRMATGWRGAGRWGCVCQPIECGDQRADRNPPAPAALAQPRHKKTAIQFLADALDRGAIRAAMEDGRDLIRAKFGPTGETLADDVGG